MRSLTKRVATGMLAGTLLAGCATAGQGGADDAVPAELPVRITFATGPCYGTCPVYGIDVASDGTGRFDGRRHTAVSGTRNLPVTPAQYRAFATALAPYRPASDRRFSHGEPGCGNAPTDMPSVDIRWSDADGTTQALHYYFGCDAANPGMSAALLRAVDTLPVAGLIGRR